MINKITLSAAALLASSTAFAAPQNLTFEVVANVPSPTLSLTPQGGWGTMSLPYNIADNSLRAASNNLDIVTDGSTDVEAWLSSTTTIENGSGDKIDLGVSIANKPLSVGAPGKVTIYPASTGGTPTPVNDIIPITVTPAAGPHLPGNYNGYVTVVYDKGVVAP